jgi:hypothetical protein
MFAVSAQLTFLRIIESPLSEPRDKRPVLLCQVSQSHFAPLERRISTKETNNKKALKIAGELERAARKRIYEGPLT